MVICKSFRLSFALGMGGIFQLSVGSRVPVLLLKEMLKVMLEQLD